MRIYPYLSAILLLSACTATQAPPVGEDPQLTHAAREVMRRAQQDNIAYEIVESLTTEVGPRQAGTEAEGRARDWAVDKLRQLGFRNVRVETFEMPVWARGVERAEIVAPFPQPLTISTLGGSASTGPDGVAGQLVSFASLSALRSVPAGSLRGKIVFVNEAMARTQDGSGYTQAVSKRRETAYEAARLGASAALIRSVGTSTHRFAHTGQMRRAGDSGEAGVPTAALAAPDADQLQRVLDRGRGVTVKLVITPRHLPVALSGNVIAEIPGSTSPQEIVLVGAHLDSWDLGTGAIDDGAGVGIVVAAAKALMEYLPEGPRRTIRVVLFGAEEVGLVGARAYAEQHARELPNHYIATESDFGAGNIWRFDTGVAENKVALAQGMGKVLQALGIGPGTNTAKGGPDLLYLRQAGVPVIGLQQNGWDYFDLHHTADDTLDKIEPDDLDQNVAAYAAFLYLAAQMDGNFR